MTASARLCRLLNLDPSIRLHPTDAWVVPQPIVPDPMPVAELIALGLLHRPELAAQRAAVIQGLLRLDGAKVLPFSPTIFVGFSAGGFAGGSNLVRPIFGGIGRPDDLDVIAYWTIQNLGVGNVALIRGADANLQLRRFQQVEILNGSAPTSPKPTPGPTLVTPRSPPTNGVRSGSSPSRGPRPRSGTDRATSCRSSS